jgi:hypothetical protein
VLFLIRKSILYFPVMSNMLFLFMNIKGPLELDSPPHQNRLRIRTPIFASTLDRLLVPMSPKTLVSCTEDLPMPQPLQDSPKSPILMDSL